MTINKHMEAAISGNAKRTNWSLAQWRAWYLEEVTQIPTGTRVTKATILDALGPIDGLALISQVRTASPDIAELLNPSQDGLDITHPGSAAFLAQLNQTHVATIQAALTETLKRHTAAGLGDPRESTIKQALEIING